MHLNSVCVISKYWKYYAESHGVRTNIFYMQIYRSALFKQFLLHQACLEEEPKDIRFIKIVGSFLDIAAYHPGLWIWACMAKIFKSINFKAFFDQKPKLQWHQCRPAVRDSVSNTHLNVYCNRRIKNKRSGLGLFLQMK